MNLKGPTKPLVHAFRKFQTLPGWLCFYVQNVNFVECFVKKSFEKIFVEKIEANMKFADTKVKKNIKQKLMQMKN